MTWNCIKSEKCFQIVSACRTYILKQSKQKSSKMLTIKVSIIVASSSHMHSIANCHTINYKVKSHPKRDKIKYKKKSKWKIYKQNMLENNNSA